MITGIVRRFKRYIPYLFQETLEDRLEREHGPSRLIVHREDIVTDDTGALVEDVRLTCGHIVSLRYHRLVEIHCKQCRDWEKLK